MSILTKAPASSNDRASRPAPALDAQTRSCIDACTACAEACDRFGNACVGLPDLADCVRACRDCAGLCRAVATYLNWRSPLANEICRAAVRASDLCAAVCTRHPGEESLRCVEACRRAASECRKASRTWDLS